MLVPVYNAGKYIGRCLDSILSQTFADIEIIVLDDGSTDDSLTITRGFADSRIVVESQPHGGIASARNRLIDLAGGEYIYFVDADDRIEPDTVRELLEISVRNNLDIAICGHAGQLKSNFAGSGNEDITTLTSWQAVERFLTSMEIPSAMWTKMVRTSVIRTLEFDPDIHYGEDTLMTWRLINRAERIAITNVRSYHYSDVSTSITNSPFSDATYSLGKVWKIIVEDTGRHRPDLISYARQKQIYCNFWLLYTALRSNCPRDERVRALQSGLKADRAQWKRVLTMIKRRIFAFLAVYAYNPLRILLAPIRSEMPTLR